MPKIQDYGIIGNGRSAALISKEGSIDWLCWPRFDSPSIFGNILDNTTGGFWKISPTSKFQIHRHYIEDTNVLQTHFKTQTGTLILTDFMLALSEEDKKLQLYPEHELIRQIHCQDGEVEVEIVFHPKPNYAQLKTVIKNQRFLGLRLEIGQQLISLHADVKFDLIKDDLARTIVKLKTGETVNFSLTYTLEGPAVIPPVSLKFVSEKLYKTTKWWKAWAKRCQYNGPYRRQVVRSALVLKLLGYAPSGALIAAPTTSLPERIGGSLNWDYRFCWLRDATWTVQALSKLGYEEETEAFINWILHSTRLTQPKLKVVYDIFGEHMGKEEILAHWKGYQNSQPVRIRNKAHDQFQLDVYGEVLGGVAFYVKQGGKLDSDMKKLLRGIGDYICENWQKKDSGIWEERSLSEHTFSKLMCWETLDKLLEISEQCSLQEKQIKRFTQQRSLIRKDIEEKGWNPSIGSYTSTYHGNSVDASLLLMPYIKFEAAHTDRMKDTYKRIKEKLSAERPGLIYRNEKNINREGAFLICSYWEIDFLLRGGKYREAQTTFEKLLKYANDLELLSEEQDPKSGDALGNFPQAYTHIGLINAAIHLEEKKNDKLG